MSRETDRWADRWTERQANRQTGEQTDRQANRQSDRQVSRETDRWTDRQTGEQTDRQVNRQTGVCVCVCVCVSYSGRGGSRAGGRAAQTTADPERWWWQPDQESLLLLTWPEPPAGRQTTHLSHSSLHTHTNTHTHRSQSDLSDLQRCVQTQVKTGFFCKNVIAVSTSRLFFTVEGSSLLMLLHLITTWCTSSLQEVNVNYMKHVSLLCSPEQISGLFDSSYLSGNYWTYKWSESQKASSHRLILNLTNLSDVSDGLRCCLCFCLSGHVCHRLLHKLFFSVTWSEVRGQRSELT